MSRVALSSLMLVALTAFSTTRLTAPALADDVSTPGRQPAAVTLTLTPTCPTGGPATIAWSGATPNGRIILIFAGETGAFRVPDGGPCGGTILGLGANLIQVVFYGPTGPTGSRTINTYTGPGACRRYLQLLDLTSCELSNVARFE